MNAWKFCTLVITCGTLGACSGAGIGASAASGGGKSSTLPLVLNLNATPAPAWLYATVTFNVTCQSVVGSQNLQYLWTFGDGKSETTTVGTDTHTYTAAAANNTYDYGVTCVDGTQSSVLQSTLAVRPYDLNPVAAGVCSTGLQGLGWCWQHPLPTGTSLRGVAAISPLNAWAVGDAGTVLETTDGGVTWTPRFPNAPGVNFLAVNAPDHIHATLTAADASVWTTSNSGTTWTRVAPTGTAAYTLTQVTMADAAHIWGIDAGSNIVHTTNGGADWSPILLADGLPAGTQLNSVSAGDTQTVWAVGNAATGAGETVGAGVVLNTNDGSNWVSGLPPTGSGGMTLNSVSVTTKSKCTANTLSPSVWVDALQPGGATNTGGIVSGVESAESVDNGATWLTSATGGGVLLAAFDANTAWQTLPYTEVESINASSDGFGYTTGGNSAWTFPIPKFPFYDQAPAFVYPAINAIDSADCQTGWAVGNAGAVLATTNGEVSYIGQAAAATPSTANNVVGLFAASGNHALALAVDTDETATTNSKTKSPQTNITTVFQVLETIDGGVTWLTEIPVVPSTSFNYHEAESGPLPQAALPQLTHGQIAGNQNGDIVAVGPGFIVVKSALAITLNYSATRQNDAGAYVLNPTQKQGTTTSWGNGISASAIALSFDLLPNAAYEIWNAVAVSNQSAWVIDGLGDVLEQDTPLYSGKSSPDPAKAASTTAGWAIVAAAASLPAANQPAAQPPPAGGNAIAAVDLNSGVVAVIVGSGGLISRTLDKGNTWTTIPTPASADLNSIDLITDGSTAGLGWAVGNGGTILRTTDAGASWAVQTWTDPSIDGTQVDFSSISSFDGTSAWALGKGPCPIGACTSIVIHTDDGGVTWTRQESGAAGMKAVVAVDANTGWLVGLDGGILKTLTGGVAPP